MAGKLMGTEVIATTHHFRDLRKLFGHYFRNLRPTLHPVVGFLEASQVLNVLRIIGVVVVDIHSCKLVKALNEHTFTIGIDETHGTNHLLHAPLTPPVLNGFQQGSRHFGIIDEVEPSEAYLTGIPAFIGVTIDDSSNTTHNLPVFISQEVVGLTIIKRRILLAVERVHFVEIEKWHSAIVAAIEIVVELHERTEFLFRGYFFNLNHYFPKY